MCYRALLKFSVPASMTFLDQGMGGDQGRFEGSPWNGVGWKAHHATGIMESLSTLPCKPTPIAIVPQWLPSATFWTPTSPFPPILADLKAVLTQTQCGTSKGWSYLSESAAVRRGNWEEGWRGLLCTLLAGEGWLLGWDKDTAPATVPFWVVCVLGNTDAETKRRDINFIRQRHKKIIK